MKNLLPPQLKCKPSPCECIWTSQVIPACKVRPLPKTNSFLGYQLMVFAKKTKKHVVFDAQVDLDIFHRTGNFSCVRACENDGMQTICAGRLDLKDNFLNGKGEQYGYSVNTISMKFFEDGVCQVVPYMVAGPQDEFQIYVSVSRGRDHGHDPMDTYFSLSYLFNECGKSLLKFVQEQTKNV